MRKPLKNCPRCHGKGILYGWPDKKATELYEERIGDRHPHEGKNLEAPCPVCFTSRWVKWLRGLSVFVLVVGMLDLMFNQGMVVGATITLIKEII